MNSMAGIALAKLYGIRGTKHFDSFSKSLEGSFVYMILQIIKGNVI